MLHLLALLVSVSRSEADSVGEFIADSPNRSLLVHFNRPWAQPDTVRRRGRAVALSDAYATRLKIHQVGAVVMLPLVVSEYFIGQSLITSEDRPSGLRTAHRLVAGGIGVVFGVNTITGVLNWWETRKDPVGRARRTIHSLLMLASDAGFLWAAASAGAAHRDLDAAVHHRAIAEASISVSVLSSVMMWIWRG